MDARRPLAKALGAFASAGLLATGLAVFGPTGAEANITPPVNGQVVRDGVITINEDRGGIQTNSSATATPASGTCATANSPYSRIEVKNAANVVVFSANSPTRTSSPGCSILGTLRSGPVVDGDDPHRQAGRQLHRHHDRP